MALELNEYLGQVLVTEDGPILPPELVARLVDELTEAEATALLHAAVGAEPADPTVYISQWLIRRFNLQFQKRQ